MENSVSDIHVLVPHLNSLKPNWFYLIANITNATPDLTFFPHAWCKTPFERWLWNCTSSYEEKCCVFKAAKGRVTSESFIKNTVFQKWMDFSREIKFQENQFTFLLTRLSIITSLVFWWYQLPKKLLSLEKKLCFFL